MLTGSTHSFSVKWRIIYLWVSARKTLAMELRLFFALTHRYVNLLAMMSRHLGGCKTCFNVLCEAPCIASKTYVLFRTMHYQLLYGCSIKAKKAEVGLRKAPFVGFSVMVNIGTL